MSASTIIEIASPDEIQAAQAVVLLRFKNQRGLTLDEIVEVMGCCKQSISQYIISDTEMAASAWIRATAHWPELNQMMLDELDVAEKAAAARQRNLKLEEAA